MSLTDKVALVTGGSSGIGAAIAIKFAEEGAKVAIVGRNQNKLKNIAGIIKKKGSTPLVIVADVTKDNDIKRIVDDTVNHFGRINILVNNVGAAGTVSIGAEHAMQVYDQTMSTNLRSAVYVTNLATQYLIESKGNIINIASVAAVSVLSKQSFSYCVSKAGLDHFTRCVAFELAEKDVRVNCINPGPVKTDIVENAGASLAIEEAVWHNLKKATLLNRISDAEEIADLALFLASDKAKSITGSSYVTDNGMLLKRVM